jgi:hypothetical protein
MLSTCALRLSNNYWNMFLQQSDQINTGYATQTTCVKPHRPKGELHEIIFINDCQTYHYTLPVTCYLRL